MTLKKTLSDMREALEELNSCYVYDEGSLHDIRTKSGIIYTKYKGGDKALSTPTPDLTPLEEVIRAARAINKRAHSFYTDDSKGEPFEEWVRDTYIGPVSEIVMLIETHKEAIKEMMGE